MTRVRQRTYARPRAEPWYPLDKRTPRYYPYWITWTEIALYAMLIFVLGAVVASLWIGVGQ